MLRQKQLNLSHDLLRMTYSRNITTLCKKAGGSRFYVEQDPLGCLTLSHQTRSYSSVNTFQNVLESEKFVDMTPQDIMHYIRSQIGDNSPHNGGQSSSGLSHGSINLQLISSELIGASISGSLRDVDIFLACDWLIRYGESTDFGGFADGATDTDIVRTFDALLLEGLDRLNDEAVVPSGRDFTTAVVTLSKWSALRTRRFASMITSRDTDVTETANLLRKGTMHFLKRCLPHAGPATVGSKDLPQLLWAVKRLGFESKRAMQPLLDALHDSLHADGDGKVNKLHEDASIIVPSLAALAAIRGCAEHSRRLLVQFAAVSAMETGSANDVKHALSIKDVRSLAQMTMALDRTSPPTLVRLLAVHASKTLLPLASSRRRDTVSPEAVSVSAEVLAALCRANPASTQGADGGVVSAVVRGLTSIVASRLPLMQPAGFAALVGSLGRSVRTDSRLREAASQSQSGRRDKVDKGDETETAETSIDWFAEKEARRGDANLGSQTNYYYSSLAGYDSSLNSGGVSDGSQETACGPEFALGEILMAIEATEGELLRDTFGRRGANARETANFLLGLIKGGRVLSSASTTVICDIIDKFCMQHESCSGVASPVINPWDCTEILSYFAYADLPPTPTLVSLLRVLQHHKATLSAEQQEAVGAALIKILGTGDGDAGDATAGDGTAVEFLMRHKLEGLEGLVEGARRKVSSSPDRGGRKVAGVESRELERVGEEVVFGVEEDEEVEVGGMKVRPNVFKKMQGAAKGGFPKL